MWGKVFYRGKHPTPRNIGMFLIWDLLINSWYLPREVYSRMRFKKWATNYFRMQDSCCFRRKGKVFFCCFHCCRHLNNMWIDSSSGALYSCEIIWHQNNRYAESIKDWISMQMNLQIIFLTYNSLNPFLLKSNSWSELPDFQLLS